MNNDFTAVLNQLRGILFWLPRWVAATIVIALVVQLISQKFK